MNSFPFFIETIGVFLYRTSDSCQAATLCDLETVALKGKSRGKAGGETLSFSSKVGSGSENIVGWASL